MKRQYGLPQWNWHRLLKRMGTANQIAAQLRGMGYAAPPRTTIQGWRNRNAVPANWVPVLIQMALITSLIDDIDDLRDDEHPDAGMMDWQVEDADDPIMFHA